jgi:hypothetical protein
MWSAIAIASGFVLHDQHGVAFIPQLQQQPVHPLDVMRVQTNSRLIENVGDVGERRAQVADHLDALRFPAGQRRGRSIEAEVAEADLDERVEGAAQRHQQRGNRRLVEGPQPLGEVGDLHRADVGDAGALDRRGSGRLRQSGARAVGAGGEGDRPLDEGPQVRLQRVNILGQQGLLDLRDEPGVGQVDPVDLDLGRLPMQQVLQFPLGECGNRLIRVEIAAAAEDPAVPALHAVARDADCAVVEGLGGVVQRREVDIGDRAPSLAPWAHTAGDAEAASLLDRLTAAPHRYRAGSADRGDIERVRLRRSDVRAGKSAEQDPEHGVGIGRRALSGPGGRHQPVLIDGDRGRQPVEDVDIGAGERGHEPLHERAIRLIDHPLGLRGGSCRIPVSSCPSRRPR